MKLAKFIAGILAAIMLTLSIMPTPSFGDTIISGDNIDPETGLIFTLLGDDTYLIEYPETGLESEKENLFIPSEYNGKKVTLLSGDIFFATNNSLKSITVPDSILEITACTDYPDGVSSLENIFVDENNPSYCSIDGVLYNKEATELIKYPNGRADNSFAVPDNVIKIGDYAFLNTMFEEVNIPDSVISIGTEAFNNCDLLKEIIIPSSVTDIKVSFKNCDSLATVIIPKSVSFIDPNAFTRSPITSFIVDNNNEAYTVINDALYTKDGKTLVIYPYGKTNTEKVYTVSNGTETIGNSSFAYNIAFESIILPNTITNIEEYAFFSSYLKYISIPEGVKSLNGTFYDCYHLKTIELPQTLTAIGKDTFTSYTNGSSKPTIKYAGTKSDWENIQMPSNSNKILDGTTIIFSDGSTDTITLTNTSGNTDNKPFQESSITINSEDNSIEFIPQIMCNSHLSSIVETVSAMKGIRINASEGAFSDNKVKLCVTPSTKSISGKDDFAVDIHFEDNDGTEMQPNIPVTVRIPIPEKFKDKDPIFVYHISDDSSVEKMEITTETIDGIRYVIFDTNNFSIYVISEQNTSDNDKFTSDKIIDGVKYTLLENGTFSVTCADPNALPKTLNIPSEINDKRVTVIEEGAFANCENLDTVSLSNSITQISKSAFENCPKLSVFTLPTSITLIDENAFNGTYLEIIYFDGTEKQWDSIEIKDGNSTLDKQYVIFSDTTSTDPKPNPDNPNKDTISTPQNIRKGNIYGRIEWDPIESAENYYITVENTITDKDGNTITYTVRSTTDKTGSTEEAWADWAFLAMPYSDEQHKITVCAYGNRQYSKESEPFYDNYTPPLSETIPMPNSVWGENIFIKWSPVESAAMYWFKILANGEQLRCSYSTTESGYIGLIPNETYDVVMYVIDKNHITFNEKTYSAKIGAVSVESIQPPKTSYNNDTDKITVTYENSTVPAIAFWARIKDENGKLIRMERFTDTEYLVGELPNGVYTIDVCTEAYINHNSDLNDFSTWSPSITLNKQVGGSTSTDNTDDENKENPDTSDPDTNTSGSDTSKPNDNENHPSTGGSPSGSSTNHPSTGGSSGNSSTSNPSTEHPSTGGVPTEHPSTGGNSSNNGDTSNDTSDNTNSNTSGETTKDAQIGNDAPNTTIVTPMGALLDSVLTPEELEQYKNGANIKITITSDNINGTVTSADVQAVKNALSDFLGYKVGIYVDMKIYKSVSGKVIPAHDLNKPITIQIEVPEDLRKIGREFIVVRVHNNIATVLNDYDENNNTITFSTDGFSTYAIAYKDKSESTTSDATTSITNPITDSNENPYTGVHFNQNLFLAIGCISLFIFLILCFFTGKNGMTEEEKERKFSGLIAWGKRGGRIRAILALTAILLLLTFYYGIGMKTSKN